MTNISARWCRTLAPLAIGAALASFAATGTANAVIGGMTNTSNVPVNGNLVTCSSVVVAGAPWTPSSFSFDISWIDPFARAYFLSDRSHGGAADPSTGLPTAGGDVMMIDINSVNLNSPNTTVNGGVTYLTPPADDPMAGIACDQNTAFGGTNAVGRNEITGPNGNFTVNHAEVWVGDGPSQFQPGQGHGTVTMSGAGTCGVDGVTCSYSGVTSDYDADPCDSSVRVFDLASHQQTDHINVGGCFRTDEGGWDPNDQVALFANPSELHGIKNGTALNQHAYINLISTKPVAPGQHHEILKQINFDGTNGTVLADMGIEQASYSGVTGLFYVSIPGASSNASGYVAVVDPKALKVVNNFTLGGGCAPNGSALGPDFELLLGCTGSAEQVIDIRTGSLITSLTGTSGGCDEVAYDEGNKTFLGACTDSNANSTDNLDVSNALPPSFGEAINTNTKGAHSVTSNPVTSSAWMPAAAGTGANAGPPAGLCAAGATNTGDPCVLIFEAGAAAEAAK